jgi:hypothetical protein
MKASALVQRMLIGAGIALILISLFLLGVDEPNPAWPKLWMIRPLVVVPLAGAFGGFLTYHIGRLLNQNIWAKIAAIVLSFIAYVFVLWIGSVLGLAGTLWN